MISNRIFIAVIALISITGFAFRAKGPSDPIELEYPSSWPTPVYDFTRNPLTRQGIALGKKLFNDPILSRDSTVSCVNCHLSYTAFTHVDHALSHGIDDRVGIRNSPTLVNLAWAGPLMWDGAVSHLDFQALAPISNPVEMDFSIDRVVSRLRQNSVYRDMMAGAFGDSLVTGERVLKALAQFQLTLISGDSKYDRVIAGNDSFTRQEQNGYSLFRLHCESCHQEPFFTNFGFEKNGLPIDTGLLDYGRMRITQNPADSLKFKVPGLRNIQFSYPYMHDGRFKKLRDVVQYYGQSRGFTNEEKVDIVAFLYTLTDRNFLLGE